MSHVPNTQSTAHQSSSLEAFEPDQLKRLQPTFFIKNCLQSNLRPDGRSLHESRPIQSDSGSIGSAHGSAIVSFGSTSVVCGVKFEISEPELTKPNQGFIVPNVDLGPMCCPKYRSGPPNDEAQLLSSRLKDILSSSDLVPSGSLVIEPGKFVWVVYIDVVCISHDGNLLDPIVLSALLALKNARKPAVKYEPNQNKVALLNPQSPETIPLEITTSIHAYSFAIFNNSMILPDPTLMEEEFAIGFLTLVIDQDSQIRHLWFAGDDLNQSDTDYSGLNYPKILEFCVNYSKKANRLE